MTIRIDGTNTAANPGITGTDTDTGLQFGTDEVNIVTGGTTRATVDSSGRVGIGTSSPGRNFQVVDSSNAFLSAKCGSVEGFVNVTSSAVNLESSSSIPVTFSPGGTLRGRFDTSGNLQFNSGYGSVATAYGVRAWVCFNGNNGTVLEDGNVSSITDNATGNYTINFATDMPDSNYAAAGNTDGNGTNSCNFGPPAVGSIGMLVFNSTSGQLGDHDKVFAIIVR